MGTGSGGDPAGRRREMGNVGRNVVETFLSGLSATGSGTATDVGKQLGGQPAAVFGEPITAGPYTVIIASEVTTSAAAGIGPELLQPRRLLALALSRGLGGDRLRGRPVAIVVIGPDGVKVSPILDLSRIALAGIAAWAAVSLTGIAAWRAVASSERSRRRRQRR